MSPRRTGNDVHPLEGRRPLAGPVLCVAVLLGWLAHDTLLLALSGEPKLMLEGLPRAFLLLASAACLGVLLNLVPELLAVLVLGTGAAALALPRIGLGLDLTRTDERLAMALFALALALAAAALLRRLLGTGAARTGLACGALSCVACWWFLRDMEAASFYFAGAAAAVLALGLVPWSFSRLLASLAVAAGFAWLVLVPAFRDAPRVLQEPPPPERVLLAAATSERPDLVLVVLDTVRASRLAPYGHTRQTTPRLDDFVRRHAVRFTNARSTSSWTLPSHASLFTGLMPAQHGATHPRRGADDERTVETAALPAQALRADVPTLASILRAEGYRTGAVLANSAYLDPRFGLARGFEHYDARPGGFLRKYIPLVQLAGSPLRAGHMLYRDAQTITDLALEWLERDDGRPSFLALNYMDAHSPYLAPPPFDSAFGPPAREPLELEYRDRADQYDRSLAYLDSQLERLLRRLDLENTLVVITSDHGEALGDHGYWMHSWALYEGLIKVPLYVKPLGPRPAAENHQPINGAQVFHRILAELGLDAPEAPFEPDLGAEWYRVEHQPTSPVLTDKQLDRDLLTWIDGDRKVIVASSGEVEVYDLSRDPDETEPLPIEEAERQAALERAQAWWREHPPPAAGAASPFDAAEQERLRALGYLGGGD